ncbi:peptidase [Streptococcus dentiloxodontae]
MKKWLKILGIGLFAMTVLAACSSKSSKSPEKSNSEKIKEAAQADAETLLNTMLGKSSNGFADLYGYNYETWTEDKVFEEQTRDIIEEDGYTPEENYTYYYISGYDAQTPTQVISTFLTTRRDMIAKIQEYKTVDVEVKNNTATVTFTSRSISGLGVANICRNLLLQLYDNDLGKLGRFNKAGASDEDTQKAKNLITYFLFGQTFQGNFLQFDDIDKEYSYTPLTGDETLEKSFKLTKDDSGHWTISPDDYKTLVSDLVDQKESSSQAIYAERYYGDVSKEKSEDSSNDSSQSGSESDAD